MSWQPFRPLFWFGAAISCLALAASAQAQTINIVPNADFEVDDDASGAPDQWFSGGGVGYVIGDDSAGLGSDSVSSPNDGDWRSQAFPIAALQTLTFSVDYKVSPGATGTARADLRFFTALAGDGGTTGNFVGEWAPTIDVATVPQGVWNTLGPFTVQVPAGNPPPLVVPHYGDVRLSAGIFGPDLSGTIQWDNVQVLVPEPATMALAAAGLLGLALLRRRVH